MSAVPAIDRGNDMCLAPKGHRLVWLVEVEPACRLLDADGSVGREVAVLLRAASAARVRSAFAPTAFRYMPAPAHARLLGWALELARDAARRPA